MTESSTIWTLDLIKKLQYWQIGDFARLDSIKKAIENDRVVYESDKQYLKEKFKELQKLEGDSDVETDPVSESNSTSTGDIMDESQLGKNESLEILKNRLARGEININEFNSLKSILLESKTFEQNQSGDDISKKPMTTNKIVRLPKFIAEEKRVMLTYNCTYVSGHSKFCNSARGKLSIIRDKSKTSVTFESKDTDIKFIIPIVSFNNAKILYGKKKFLSKKEDMKLNVIYDDNEYKTTESPIFELNDNVIMRVQNYLYYIRSEMNDPSIHTFRTRNGVNSLEIDMLSPQMHPGESILWSQRLSRNNSENLEIHRVVTNFRVFTYDVEDEMMLRYLDLANVDDVVVTGRFLDSKSKGTTYFVGGYGNHLAGGIAPTNINTLSNSVGNVVFMHQGEQYITLNNVPDPDGIASMVKSVLNELYPRK